MTTTRKSAIENNNVGGNFFFLLLVIISVITFLIFQPFAMAILLAAVLAVIFKGTYKFFLRIFRGLESISSLASSIIVLLIIIVPLSLIFVLVGNEIGSIYKSISSSGNFFQQYIQPAIFRIQSWSFYGVLDLQQFLNQETFLQYSGQAGQILLGAAQKTYQSIAHFMFLAFVMFFSLYYFFIDGEKMVKSIMKLAPLRESHEKILIEKFVSISRATIKGSLVLGFIQGILGGVTFSIAGVPSAITWGVVMMFFSLIPLFGSGIIWVPAGLILLSLGHVWQGFFVLAVGFGIISVVDNLLRPKFVGKDTQMHPLAVFGSTVGGISLFGFFGFILGPVIMALFLSLWEIYSLEFKGRVRKNNA